MCRGRGPTSGPPRPCCSPHLNPSWPGLQPRCLARLPRGHLPSSFQFVPGRFLPHIYRPKNMWLHREAHGWALPSARSSQSPLPKRHPQGKLGPGSDSGGPGSGAVDGFPAEAPALTADSAPWHLLRSSGHVWPPPSGSPRSQMLWADPQCTCLSHQIPATKHSAGQSRRPKALLPPPPHPPPAATARSARRRSAVSICCTNTRADGAGSVLDKALVVQALESDPRAGHFRSSYVTGTASREKERAPGSGPASAHVAFSLGGGVVAGVFRVTLALLPGLFVLDSVAPVAIPSL